LKLKDAAARYVGRHVTGAPPTSRPGKGGCRDPVGTHLCVPSLALPPVAPMTLPAGSPDPLDQQIEQALSEGWTIIPQVGHGTCDNALIRVHGGLIDLATVPTIGYSTVVRLLGGPLPGQPREVGYQQWRHHVPTQIAVAWALTHPTDDRTLADWNLRSRS